MRLCRHLKMTIETIILILSHNHRFATKNEEIIAPTGQSSAASSASSCSVGVGWRTSTAERAVRSMRKTAGRRSAHMPQETHAALSMDRFIRLPQTKISCRTKAQQEFPNQGIADKMKPVRLAQIFRPNKETNRTHSKGYVEDLSTQCGQKRCAKMARLNLSVLPKYNTRLQYGVKRRSCLCFLQQSVP